MTDAEQLEALRLLIVQQPDVKKLLRLEKFGAGFRYQIETPFATFPKFVIGVTDIEFEMVRLAHRCGLIESSDRAWAEMAPDGSIKSIQEWE